MRLEGGACDHHQEFRRHRCRRLRRSAPPEGDRETGNRLVAAVDPHDAVGILDRYSFDVRFFTEFERFDRHLEKLRRGPAAERVALRLSICSPNYLHDAHIRLALRVGADAICEKPLVINPWNLDALEELEQETGRRVYTVLQLRLHPALHRAARAAARRAPAERHDVVADLRHRARPLVRRVVEGVGRALRRHRHEHRHPLLRSAAVAVRAGRRVRGAPARAAADGGLPRAGARARALVPVDRRRRSAVRAASPAGRRRSDRSPSTGTRSSSATGFADLHTRVYEEVLAGRGFGIDDSRPSIELAHRIRHAAVTAAARGACIRPAWRRRDERTTRPAILRPRIVLRRRRLRDRRGHEDLALQPRHDAARDRRALQHRPERRHLAGRRHRRQREDPEQRVGVHRRRRSKTTCSAGRRWCSPTSSTRAATCRGRTSTGRRS